MTWTEKMKNLSDDTLRHYTDDQAKQYAASRLSYPRKLYETVIRYHADTNGKFGTLLDIGCGPGNATRDLAPFFERAVGIDPGVEMVQAAQRLGGTTRTNEAIQFLVATAESCGELAEVSAGVELLVSAMAAHWFSMAEFWASAAKILNRGGTVALWTCASLYCHPSTQNAAEIQKALLDLEQGVLKPYELPQNQLSRNLYDDLVLPWHLDPPIQVFSRAGFQRLEWDRDGMLSDGEEEFFVSRKSSLEELESSLGTASMVTRWRVAHPELAGTESDCVRVAIGEIRKILGVDWEGELGLGHSSVLLLFKKE